MSSSEPILNTNPTTPRVMKTNEKVTSPVAAEMLRLSQQLQARHSSGSAAAPAPPLEVLDNACGIGVVAAQIFNLVAASEGEVEVKRVITGDRDPLMINFVRQRAGESGWPKDKFDALVFDQQSPPPALLPKSSFTHIYNNFGVFFSPDDEAVLTGTLGLLKPGGIAGFTTWKDVPWWREFAVPAVRAFVPQAPALPADPGSMFPPRGWNDPDAARLRLEKAGFEDAEAHVYGFTPDVEPEEFAEACAALVGSVAKKVWSEEENRDFGGKIEPAILKYLKENYPGGRWDGVMQAVVTLGRKS